jgi:hypothetical protein
VSSTDDTFSKEGGHESREKFPVSFWPKYFFLLWEVVLYGSVQFIRVHTVVQILHKNRGILGMVFEADFNFFVVVSRSYGTVCTADYGHGKRGIEEVIQ